MSEALFRSMLRIRMVEEAIAARYPEEQMRCPVHLSIGQEATAAGVGLAFLPGDQAVSTHRSHAHYLAVGGDLQAMLAELHGKATGCCGGRGGSMHLSDPGAGFVASTAIVGNSIPVGVGIALAQQLKNSNSLTCVFFGDGATEEGAFYEAANFAALRRLPVLFVCENNLYSVYSPLSKRQPPGRSLAGIARALGLRAFEVDGNDAVAVHAASVDAMRDIRAGLGPVFLECATYRWREHCGPNFDDELGYRPSGELAIWQEHDPLSLLGARLALAAGATADMRAEIAGEIEAAFAAAAAAPFPDPQTREHGVYREEQLS